MKYHIYRDRKKEWRWWLKARNGRILSDSSEGYKRKGAVIAVIRKICRANLMAELDIVDDGAIAA